MIKSEALKQKKFTMPNAYVIIFFVIMITCLATWVVPPGAFEYEKVDVNGNMRNVVVPGTFQYLPEGEAKPVGLMGFLSSFHRGLISASEVVFLSFLAYSSFYLIMSTGAMDALIGTLLKKFSGKEKIIIPLFFTVFALGSSFLGMWSEYYGFFPILVGLGTALGYDAMVGFAIIQLGIGVGFATSIMNPFTVVIAQSLAGLPLYSATGFRVVMSIIFYSIGIWWILRYCKIIKADPTKSIVYGDKNLHEFNKDDLLNYKMTQKHVIILLEMLVCISVTVYGMLKLDWGVVQLSGIFLLMGIVAAVINGWGPNKISEELLIGCGKIAYGAMIAGVARAILIVLQDGKIVDTLINFLGSSLQSLPSYFSAQGMLIAQTIINFLIPSGSGQAATTVPILVPVGDLVGVSRQVVVLAYQFGDGFSNLLWPTSNIAIGCGLAGIPINKWWKFFVPLFLIMFVVQLIMLTVAVIIGV